MSGLSGSYRKDMCSKATAPRTRSSRTGSAGSGSSSASSRTANTRSADAIPDCTRLTRLASCVIGIVNCREYWMKACTSPSEICPEATRKPPITAMPT